MLSIGHKALWSLVPMVSIYDEDWKIRRHSCNIVIAVADSSPLPW